ncbi:hypothetical protein EYF80_029827 [Liparis tanakae]|uniref:Uncharacterized protein n=1 Tax=Liparis tanakae TaxID=230148 RepID=A0A4Z2H3W4_9TELE|nr:hypothetical protein EYF80_029827 [Liparis tanakae]
MHTVHACCESRAAGRGGFDWLSVFLPGPWSSHWSLILDLVVRRLCQAPPPPAGIWELLGTCTASQTQAERHGSHRPCGYYIYPPSKTALNVQVESQGLTGRKVLLRAGGEPNPSTPAERTSPGLNARDGKNKRGTIDPYYCSHISSERPEGLSDSSSVVKSFG